QRGCLAGAVGPDETEERPTRNLKVQTVDGECRPEGLGQATQTEHRGTSPRWHIATVAILAARVSRFMRLAEVGGDPIEEVAHLHAVGSEGFHLRQIELT